MEVRIAQVHLCSAILLESICSANLPTPKSLKRPDHSLCHPNLFAQKSWQQQLMRSLARRREVRLDGLILHYGVLRPVFLSACPSCHWSASGLKASCRVKGEGSFSTDFCVVRLLIPDGWSHWALGIRDCQCLDHNHLFHLLQGILVFWPKTWFKLRINDYY